MCYNNEITTTDSEGNTHNFVYCLDKSNEQGKIKWIFRVIPQDLDIKDIDWYEFAITKINRSTGKITIMNNRNMVEYRGKGITEKIIQEAYKALNLNIISSSNINEYKELDSEFRTEPATRIWKRLMEQNLATYDINSDIYTYSPL